MRQAQLCNDLGNNPPIIAASPPIMTSPVVGIGQKLDLLDTLAQLIKRSDAAIDAVRGRKTSAPRHAGRDRKVGRPLPLQDR